jgi:hypothetical protein
MSENDFRKNSHLINIAECGFAVLSNNFVFVLAIDQKLSGNTCTYLIHNCCKFDTNPTIESREKEKKKSSCPCLTR